MAKSFYIGNVDDIEIGVIIQCTLDGKRMLTEQGALAYTAKVEELTYGSKVEPADRERAWPEPSRIALIEGGQEVVEGLSDPSRTYWAKKCNACPVPMSMKDDDVISIDMQRRSGFQCAVYLDRHHG